MEKWYQVVALSVGGVLGVNARYWLGVVINRWAGGAISLGNVHDQHFRIVRDRAFVCAAGSLDATSARPAVGGGRVPGRIHNVFVFFL